MKFKNEEDIETIRNQPSMGMVAYHGHNKQYELRPNFKLENLKQKTKDDHFDSPNVNLMYRVNLEKYKQNPSLKDELLQTGDSAIIFRDSSSFWNKWNGIILEKIRNELKS